MWLYSTELSVECLAIEAGILMALGSNARKTVRYKSIRDVFKFGCDFALTRLFLHNQGPQALPASATRSSSSAGSPTPTRVNSKNWWCVTGCTRC